MSLCCSITPRTWRIMFQPCMLVSCWLRSVFIHFSQVSAHGQVTTLHRHGRDLLVWLGFWLQKILAVSLPMGVSLSTFPSNTTIGLIGTNIFLDREGPQYPTGYGVSLGVICLGASCALLMEFCLWKSNNARAQRSEAEIRQKYSQEELDAMGERSPLYKYTL